MSGARPCGQRFAAGRSRGGARRTRAGVVGHISGRAVTFAPRSPSALRLSSGQPVTASRSLVLVLALAGSADTASADPPVPRVRAATVQVRAVIDDIAGRSRVVRDLLDRLACTDVIVYVEFTASPQIPLARTKLVTTVPGARFLRIGISRRVSGPDVGAMLAHELQHAVEIAEAADVRDDDGVRRLFQRIGRAIGADEFETEAAGRVEAIVRAELRLKLADDRSDLDGRRRILHAPDASTGSRARRHAAVGG